MVKKTSVSAMVLTSEWAQVEYVDLTNDGHGLGFNLVGGRSTGVVIKYVLPGGVADKDGRLQSGDHVLQVGSVNLRGFTSEQVASVLRQAGPSVRLLVARPSDQISSLRPAPPGTAIVPTKMLSDPEQLDSHLIEAGYATVFVSQCYEDYINGENGIVDPNILAAVSIIANPDQEVPLSPVIAECLSPTVRITVPVELQEVPEVETIHVELNKNVYGLGITVAGYVCEKEELSGIFVKSIIEGSSAEQSGSIRVNDRIIEVDGISLLDKSNPQAVDILKSTGISVKLVLERYLRGPKFEHLQLAIFNNEAERPSSPSPPSTTLTWFQVPSQQDNTTTEIEPELESSTTIDSSILEVADIDPELSQEELDKKLDEILSVNERDIMDKWMSEIGPQKEIIVAEVNKLSGLGISLEGTVDVEGGQELRPHHYIRSVLPEGPVGQHGSLVAGDELLEVNEYCLHGLTHTEVVQILKKLPNRVRLVCARSVTESGPRPVVNLSQDREGFEARKIISGSLNNLTTLVKAHSDGSLNTTSTATLTNNSGSSKKSHSLQCVSSLAMWQSTEDILELFKGDQGLGFSILDYQDPMDPEGTVIVVRSLVPGGVAEKSGKIAPGDRVLSVNGVSIKNATLDHAVQALKGAQRGVVRVGLAHPVPSQETSSKSKSTVKDCS